MADAERKTKNSGPIAEIITRADEDAAAMRANWECSQKDLDREKQSRRAESAQTTAQIAELQEKLKNTTVALEKTLAPGSRRKKTALIVFACVALSLALGFLVSFALVRSGKAAATTAQPSGPRVARARLAEIREETPRQLPQQVPQSRFSSSASRLSGALDSVPGRSPEQIFRELNARSSKDDPVCPIEWTGDQPAMVFSSGKSQIGSLDTALSRCAEAVERLK